MVSSVEPSISCQSCFQWSHQSPYLSVRRSAVRSVLRARWATSSVSDWLMERQHKLPNNTGTNREYPVGFGSESKSQATCAVCVLSLPPVSVVRHHLARHTNLTKCWFVHGSISARCGLDFQNSGDLLRSRKCHNLSYFIISTMAPLNVLCFGL